MKGNAVNQNEGVTGLLSRYSALPSNFNSGWVNSIFGYGLLTSDHKRPTFLPTEVNSIIK